MTPNTHLHHIAVIVTNVEKSSSFYRSVFNFPPITRLTQSISAHRGAWFQLGNLELHLQERTSPVEKTEQHFALVTDDFDGVLSRVKENGGRVEEAKVVGGFTKRAFLYDTDSNRIELLAR